MNSFSNFSSIFFEFFAEFLHKSPMFLFFWGLRGYLKMKVDSFLHFFWIEANELRFKASIIFGFIFNFFLLDSGTIFSNFFPVFFIIEDFFHFLEIFFKQNFEKNDFWKIENYFSPGKILENTFIYATKIFSAIFLLCF